MPINVGIDKYQNYSFFQENVRGCNKDTVKVRHFSNLFRSAIEHFLNKFNFNYSNKLELRFPNSFYEKATELKIRKFRKEVEATEKSLRKLEKNIRLQIKNNLPKNFEFNQKLVRKILHLGQQRDQLISHARQFWEKSEGLLPASEFELLQKRTQVRMRSMASLLNGQLKSIESQMHDALKSQKSQYKDAIKFKIVDGRPLSLSSILESSQLTNDQISSFYQYLNEKITESSAPFLRETLMSHLPSIRLIQEATNEQTHLFMNGNSYWGVRLTHLGVAEIALRTITSLIKLTETVLPVLPKAGAKSLQLGVWWIQGNHRLLKENGLNIFKELVKKPNAANLNDSIVVTANVLDFVVRPISYFTYGVSHILDLGMYAGRVGNGLRVVAVSGLKVSIEQANARYLKPILDTMDAVKIELLDILPLIAVVLAIQNYKDPTKTAHPHQQAIKNLDIIIAMMGMAKLSLELFQFKMIAAIFGVIAGCLSGYKVYLKNKPLPLPV